MRILRLYFRITIMVFKENYYKQSVLVPFWKEKKSRKYYGSFRVKRIDRL